MELVIEDLRKLCENESIRWTLHILKRLMLRSISQDDVVQTILSGEIIEQYPEDYPYPSCLILGSTSAGEKIHVVCGRGKEDLWMITAYTPDPDEWEDDLKTRKKVSQ